MVATLQIQLANNADQLAVIVPWAVGANLTLKKLVAEK